jgi:rhodanese-related sulfurtransferase
MKETLLMTDEYVSPQELRRLLDTAQAPIVSDVRGDDEYAAGHLPSARHIPGDTLAQRLNEIPRDRLVVPY